MNISIDIHCLTIKILSNLKQKYKMLVYLLCFAESESSTIALIKKSPVHKSKTNYGLQRKPKAAPEMVSDIGSLFGRIPLDKVLVSDKKVEQTLSDDNEDSDSECRTMRFDMSDSHIGLKFHILCIYYNQNRINFWLPQI